MRLEAFVVYDVRSTVVRPGAAYTERREALGSSLAALFIGCAILATGCTTSAPPPPESHVPPSEEPYLLDPSTGYPLAADASLEARVHRGFAVFGQGGDLASLESDLNALIEAEPGFHPARVLGAQIAYLRGDLSDAGARLSPVVDELPDYVAARLLAGRVAERLDDLPAAFAAYRQLAEVSSLARRRATELAPAALEIEIGELEDLLLRGRFPDVESRLAELEEWAGEGWLDAASDGLGSPLNEVSGEAESLAPEWLDQHLALLEIRRQLTVARGDIEGEIDIVRRMLEAAPDNDEYLERLGDLEITTGDVRSGLELFERLASRRPDDQALAEKLARTKFLRRLELLPSFVRQISAAGQLDRADFATMLYWLVPGVRYAEVSDPPIATDILDHPRREEILRVMNLGLVRVDETLHRFSPRDPMTRKGAFEALLGLLSLSDREFSCLSAVEAAAIAESGPRELVCAKAAQCRLIPEAGECLPRASISGPEALDLFRHALDLLESF